MDRNTRLFLEARNLHPITFEELKENRKQLYCGYPVKIVDLRLPKDDSILGAAQEVKETTIKTWYKHVIEFENGLTCTMTEFAAYLRNPNKPLCTHFKTLVNYSNGYLRRKEPV